MGLFGRFLKAVCLIVALFPTHVACDMCEIWLIAIFGSAIGNVVVMALKGIGGGLGFQQNIFFGVINLMALLIEQGSSDKINGKSSVMSFKSDNDIFI
jgi:hypothetical protein